MLEVPRLGISEHVEQAREALRREELALGRELSPTFGAIVIPSYGMSRWEDGSEYRLSFFSGVVCKAAFEMWRGLGARKIIIEGARIFPGDPKNDGDLMKDLLLRLGVPEDVIVQRRDNHNTYEQLLDARRALEELGIPQDEAVFVYADLHKQRIPKLLKNYKINSDSITAEEWLSGLDRYRAFREVWEQGYRDREGRRHLGIKHDPSYLEKAVKVEAKLARALKFDPRGRLARVASRVIFPIKGADVPDVRHRQTVRSY